MKGREGKGRKRAEGIPGMARKQTEGTLLQSSARQARVAAVGEEEMGRRIHSRSPEKCTPKKDKLSFLQIRRDKRVNLQALLYLGHSSTNAKKNKRCCIASTAKECQAISYPPVSSHWPQKSFMKHPFVESFTNITQDLETVA